MVVNEQLEMVEKREGKPLIFWFFQNHILEGFFLSFTHNVGTASPLPCFRKRKKKGTKEKICIFVLYYVLQVANSLCQLSVGVQPFRGNMLYLLSSCVCDIRVLLLCKAMNGAIMRSC